MKFEITEYEPGFGPPKPASCLDGPTCHVWQFSIQEGSITLTCDCRLCSDGLVQYAEVEDFGSEPLDVRLAPHIERSYDGDTWVWWEIIPVATERLP